MHFKFYFKKRTRTLTTENHKDNTTETIFKGKSTLAISISLLTLIVTVLTSCQRQIVQDFGHLQPGGFKLVPISVFTHLRKQQGRRRCRNRSTGTGYHPPGEQPPITRPPAAEMLPFLQRVPLIQIQNRGTGGGSFLQWLEMEPRAQ